jgi:ATPase subunit of ABC transporter with duplicated ATPase domains
MALDLEGWRGSQKVLEIVALNKVFDDGAEAQIVLAGLDLLIWHGQRVGLLGGNGAGKSVLLRCILGQEAPTGGVIKVGPSVRTASTRRSTNRWTPATPSSRRCAACGPCTSNRRWPFWGRSSFPITWCASG